MGVCYKERRKRKSAKGELINVQGLGWVGALTMCDEWATRWLCEHTKGLGTRITLQAFTATHPARGVDGVVHEAHRGWPLEGKRAEGRDSTRVAEQDT